MKQIGLAIFFLAGLVFILPSSSAQTEKKDSADKAEKKTDENKDPAKKDDEKKDLKKKDDEKKDAKKDDDKKDPKKDDDKKDPKKKDPDAKKKDDTKKASDKLVYAYKFTTKVMSAGGTSNRDFAVETKEVDPDKVKDLQNWQNERTTQLSRQLFDLNLQTDVNARAQGMLNYQRALYDFKVDLSKRQGNIYSTKAMDIRAADNVRVRTIDPPLAYDDQGFEKKWTKKERDAAKDKTGLPGYPADLDAIKSGQTVDVYMAKKAAPKAATKKKGPADDDPRPVVDRPEFVMIVIHAEKKK